mgnify:FL=1
MKLIAALLLLIVLAFAARSVWLSFRAQSPADYAGTEPAFSLQRHLSGDLLCEGIIYGPTGRVTSRFTARMVGDWEGDTGTLTEAFTYANGRTQNRKWTLQMQDATHFTATADDIIGEARGELSGATLKMSYRIRLPEDAGGHVLDATDWLYLTGDGVIINRSEMRKFGIKVAELIATMRPAPTAPE